MATSPIIDPRIAGGALVLAAAGAVALRSRRTQATRA
ncbi:hypothetical protein ATL40_0145 [Serinibacter salmoneus]|uniref:Uncharacterized protein n=1 Tax=Serinibacter salmoneus TaxID=556530 RepID=A0A2A9CX72_9MICO|nr:hypothetical protein ATL40_0145 [Serinibacter salmoneus]